MAKFLQNFNPLFSIFAKNHQIQIKCIARKTMQNHGVSANDKKRQPTSLGESRNVENKTHISNRFVMHLRMSRGNKSFEQRMRLIGLALKFRV